MAQADIKLVTRQMKKVNYKMIFKMSKRKKCSNSLIRRHLKIQNSTKEHKIKKWRSKFVKFSYLDNSRETSQNEILPVAVLFAVSAGRKLFRAKEKLFKINAFRLIAYVRSDQLRLLYIFLQFIRYYLSILVCSHSKTIEINRKYRIDYN